jgi:muconate cycloisomerase
MRVRAATVYALDIPFVEAFCHSTRSRSASDSLVVRIEGDDGAVGWGEGVPRPYVTGETVEAALDYMRGTLWPAIAAHEFADFDAALPADPLPTLAIIDEALPDRPAGPVRAWGAARCAFELALVDCLLRRRGSPAAALLPPRRPFVVYSGVITTGGVDKAVETAKRFALFGIKQLKIKIGLGNDVERVAAVRAAVGPEASLRLDANGAFASPEDALALLRALEPHRIDSVEQPLPHGPPDELARLRRASPIPVMVDESLVTAGDARAIIAAGACDFFNLRVSKHGGLGPSLAIASLARAAGVRLQVGAQVGETAILSAAGRHLAAHLDPEFVEGSFGTLLLTEDIARDAVAFGHGGKGALLTGAGLGVKVDEARVARLSGSTLRLGPAA